MKPSKQQQRIIDWTVHDSGHCVIEARAGCGKTSTIRLQAHAINKHSLGNVFIGAYNKQIQIEIQDKLAADGVPRDAAVARTMHAAGMAICKDNMGNKLRVEEKKVYSLIQTMGMIAKRNAGTIQQAVSIAKQCLLDPHVAAEWEAAFDHYGLNDVKEGDKVKDIIELSQYTLLRSNENAVEDGLIDFDDMVYLPIEYGMPVRQVYTWVMIDEAQDINEARKQLAFRLLAPNGRMVVVGDPHQAIYGFTGADAESISNLRNALSPNCVTMPLTVTYRCPKEVVKEANKYVKDITAHSTAPTGAVLRGALYDASKGGWKTADGKEHTFVQTDAILCRNTRPLVQLAYALIKNKIACKVEGRDIGNGLKKLIDRWKITTTTQLRDKLEGYLEREREKWQRKGREEMMGPIEDKVDTVNVLIDVLNTEGKHDITDLRYLIDSLFQDTGHSNAPMLTLSTIHKSKGREWDRVFILDSDLYMPSAYAKKDWQIQQEKNLAYVAITRAKNTLIYLSTGGALDSKKDEGSTGAEPKTPTASPIPTNRQKRAINGRVHTDKNRSIRRAGEAARRAPNFHSDS